jgi:hypothetical protein
VIFHPKPQVEVHLLDDHTHQKSGTPAQSKPILKVKENDIKELKESALPFQRTRGKNLLVEQDNNVLLLPAKKSLFKVRRSTYAQSTSATTDIMNS